MGKSFPIKPVAGLLDLRSEPEDVPAGGYRWVENMRVALKNKMCRAPGWSRLMDRDAGYNNQDFHDQLLTITGKSARKPVTFQFEAQSTLKQTSLLLGTEDGLFALNVGTGNYLVLTDTLGNFKFAAQNRDTVVLTNDHDRPQHWIFGQPDLAVIPDLEKLGITKVGVVLTFRGITLYMNIVEKGRTFSNRILWSDLDNALSLIPSQDSVAGDLDLDSGEAILNAKVLGNIVLIYTTRGIWQFGFSGGNEIFSASKRYDPERSGEGILAYPRTLVSTGDTHVYMTESEIAEYSLFEPKPKRLEWVHRASSVIYDDLDKANCDGPVAGFNSDKHEIWISWPARAEVLPARTLVLNTQFPFSTIVDHGFTSFCQFMPREPVLVLRDWILETCLCTEEELVEVFGAFTREGGYCEAPAAVTCETQPDAFYTTVTQELEDGIVMEDWNEVEPSANSLCSRLLGVSLAQLCIGEAQSDQCNAARLFVMASADDFCLKQSDDSYFREICTGFTGCGTYTTRGYKSILRSGPLSFKNLDDEKRLEGFMVEFSALAANVPAQLTLRVGASEQALDPNLDCGIIWQAQPSQALKCLSTKTEAQHLADNTRPDAPLSWPLYWIGKNLYFELTIENKNSTPIDVGGAACFSKFVMEMTPQARRY